MHDLHYARSLAVTISKFCPAVNMYSILHHSSKLFAGSDQKVIEAITISEYRTHFSISFNLAFNLLVSPNFYKAQILRLI